MNAVRLSCSAPSIWFRTASRADGGTLMTALRRMTLILLLAMVTGCHKSAGDASSPSTAQPSGSVATITANPNPVSAGSGKGTTIISWDTGDGSLAEVYVAVNDGPEKRFSGKRAQGSQEANWIGKGAYEFRLYKVVNDRTLLASVKVPAEGP